jgi:hypothetical protein
MMALMIIAYVDRVSVRDLLKRVDLGVYSDRFTYNVPAQDAIIVKFTPL